MNYNQSNNLLFSLKTISKTNKSGRKTLGVGGGGRVDLIHHSSDNSKLYAMKTVCLHGGRNLLRIKTEIRIHQKMNHPNIIKMYGSEFIGDNVYIFLDFASHGDLYSALRNKNNSKSELTFSSKIKIFIQCVKAVDYMHSRGFLHRDLKLENILLEKGFNVKICDFGWAIEKEHNTRRRSICGTIEYMAPEIFENKLQSTKIDIWALGRLFFC